jgi:hypothetical protein
MKPTPRSPHFASSPRGGLSLLELVIACSLLAALMMAVGVVLRTGRQAWEAHEADYTRLEALHSTVRHIVRQARQAAAVTEISAAADASGRLGLQMADGTVLVWDHDAGTNRVNCGVTAPSDLLAENITSLRFTAYEADGVTPAALPGAVQSILIEAGTQLPRESGGSRTVSSWVWIRSW